MSVIGKANISLRKKDVTNQKSIGVGFTKVVFSHKASGGETSIDLTNLTTPTELSSVGFVQPSSAQLVDLSLLFYRKNLTLISSLTGNLMDFLSYTVNSNTLIKLNYALAENEIITGIVDPAPKNDLLVVDGGPIVATGTLAIAATDFAVGAPFEINKFPTQQVGAVKVYRNGVLQARNESNLSGGLGNYIEVANGSSLSNLIRFNVAPSGQADNIIVTSNGSLIERPNGSMMAVIDTLAGQVDAVIETLAVVAGVPETNFQAAPNNVDLKQFSDRVLAAENDIDELEENRIESNVSGLFHHLGAKILCDSTSPSVNKEYGDWIDSITRNGAGDYTINIKSGVFSNSPIINVTWERNLVNTRYAVSAWVTSSSTASIRVLFAYVDDAVGDFVKPGDDIGYLHITALGPQ